MDRKRLVLLHEFFCVKLGYEVEEIYEWLDRVKGKKFGFIPVDEHNPYPCFIEEYIPRPLRIVRLPNETESYMQHSYEDLGIVFVREYYKKKGVVKKQVKNMLKELER